MPHGTFSQFGDAQVYTVAPPDLTAETSTLLFLPDGFGLASHNIILCDLFASQGWLVLMPDYFEGELYLRHRSLCLSAILRDTGDALPIGVLGAEPTVILGDRDQPLTAEAPAMIDFKAWLQRHNHQRIERLTNQVVNHLQEQRPGSILQGVGYCFGGKHVLRLSRRVLRAAVAFHPVCIHSYASVPNPSDIESKSFVEAEDCHKITVPLYIGLAGEDEMVPATLQQDLASWLQREPGREFMIERYEGMTHGFAARPNTEDFATKKEFERAFDRTVKFLREHR